MVTREHSGRKMGQSFAPKSQSLLRAAQAIGQAPKSRPLEHRTAADLGDHRAGDDRSNAWHRHQPLASGILTGHNFELPG